MLARSAFTEKLVEEGSDAISTQLPDMEQNHKSSSRGEEKRKKREKRRKEQKEEEKRERREGKRRRGGKAEPGREGEVLVLPPASATSSLPSGSAAHSST